MERCKEALTRFKEFTHGIACSTAGHALVVVRSLYPSVKLEVVNMGFARGTTVARTDKLEEKVEESTIKLGDDLNLFGNNDN